MSKSKKPAGAKAKAKTPNQAIPGAVGGPSTAKGINYQVDFAIEKALSLISRSLCAPLTNWVVRMEPRTTGGGGATQWDLGTEPPKSLFEAKYNPTREDILDWVKRLATAAIDPDGHFVLVHAKGGGTLLPSLEKLIRNAIEAAGDKKWFDDLLAMEPIAESAMLLGMMGADSHFTLQRARIECHPEAGLAEGVDMRAQMLVGERDAKRLVDLLFRTFSQAMTLRVATPVRDLIARIQGEGMTLNVPSKIDPANVPPVVVEAIAALQACPQGVPTDVLAAAVRRPRNELLRAFTGLVQTGALTEKYDVWFVRPIPPVTCAELADLLARALEALLAYCSAHKLDGTWQSQVDNVIALGRRCMSTHPAVVEKVYRPLEKMLKRKGDKHLVLLMSGLAVEAARLAVRTDEEVKAEAQALICGQSWVYQRIGRLTEARAFAERSLELGEHVGWDRNTAYCKKCIGRLKRMEAEQLEIGTERDQLLAESVASLEEGIRRFGVLSGFGSSHAEVGECYSLLARTHLVAGRLDDADQCVTEAENRLTDPNDKDYLDLQILQGDLTVAKGDRARAEDFYELATKPAPHGDSERSEIRARAIYRRGRNRADGGLTGSARKDFEESASIWRDLGEHWTAAGPAWDAILLEENPPANLIAHLANEPPVIRVAAISAYKKRLAACGTTVPSALANQTPEICTQCVDEAGKWVAVNVVNW